MRHLATLLSALALCLPTTAASAVTGELMNVSAYGLLNPGLGIEASNHDLDFAGSASVVRADGSSATYECGFSGNDYGNVTMAVGSFDGVCGPWTWYSCAFVRVANEMTVTCLDSTGDVVAGELALYPVDTHVPDPHSLTGTTAYWMTGALGVTPLLPQARQLSS